MTNADPAAFNSETTGVFKVQTLAGVAGSQPLKITPVDEGYPLMERADEYGDPGHLAERLEERAARVAQVPLSDPSVGIDEYGHRTDCQGCSAPTCGPPVQDTAYGYLPPAETITPIGFPPVSLVYAHSDGKTFTRVDTGNLLTHRTGDGNDREHRERLLLRALLEHTLAMLKGEDVS